MRRAAKIDVNQPDIVRVLRGVGATVQHLHTLGQGVPDIMVGFRGRTYLMEIKTANGDLTPAETKWHEWWRGDVYIVRTEDEALSVIGVVE